MYKRQAQGSVLVHVALREDDADLWVEPAREQPRSGFERASADLSRVVFDRERVQVDDAEDRVGLVLVRDPLAEGAEVVADVRRAGRLHSREHPFHPVQDTGRRPKAGNSLVIGYPTVRHARPVTSLVWGTRSTPTYSRGHSTCCCG